MIILTDQGALMDIIDAKPTADEIEEIREDMADMPERKNPRYRSAGGWRPTYDDWLYERDTCRHHADEANRLRAERDAYAKQVETLTKERDRARSELDLCTGRLQTAVAAVAELRHDATLLRDELAHARQAADECAAKAREYEHLFGPLMPVSGPVLRADDAVTQPVTPCPHSKAKQVGSSSFVMRRCKRADGHEGMCEPA